MSMLESKINILSILQYAKLGLVHLKSRHVKTSIFLYMFSGLILPTIPCTTEDDEFETFFF